MKARTWIIGMGATLGIVAYGIWGCSEIGNYPDKLWLHRCNSIEKWEELESVYDNIEVDLVYRGHGVFDVTHDADTTFGLHIDSYFKILGEKEEDEHMWLDIKNVTAKNVDKMHDDLDSLREVYDIEKDQLIIESSNWKALDDFTKDNYYTSFYVPFDKPHNLTEEEIDECIDSLQYIVDTKTVRALSFPRWWYTEIKEHLHRPIDLLTWCHRTTQWEFFMRPRYNKMLDDPQLKVILIKSKGHYHR